MFLTSDLSTIISQLLIIIGILVVVVNIITEVVKLCAGSTGSTKKINIFVLILSLALSVAALLAYWQIKQLVITWYVIVAFLIVGFMVAFGAMFGYDKLLSYLEPYIKKLFGIKS